MSGYSYTPIVVGGNHQNPLGVIEALGQKGVYSDVIIVSSYKSSFVLESKYIRRGWHVKTYDEALIVLRNEYIGSGKKYILYACCDDAVSFIDENYAELNSNIVLPGIGRKGVMAQWLDKRYMTDFAEKLGMAIPKSWVVNKDTDLREIEYPCITKSVSSVGKGKSEFVCCTDEASLRAMLEKLSADEVLQVQHKIDVEYEFQYIGCSLNGGELIVIPGRTNIEQTWDFNNVTFLEYDVCKPTDNPDTLQTAQNYIRRTGYSGLFSIEFLHGKDGLDYFLEVNFRNDGNGYCVTKAGFNLPYIYYLYASGDDYMTEIRNSSVTRVYSAPEDSYFIGMLNGRIPFKRWFTNMRKVNSFVTYFPGNSKPFWSLMWLQKRAIFSAMIQRIFRMKKK